MMYDKFGDPSHEIKGGKEFLTDRCGVPGR